MRWLRLLRPIVSLGMLLYIALSWHVADVLTTAEHHPFAPETWIVPGAQHVGAFKVETTRYLARLDDFFHLLTC